MPGKANSLATVTLLLAGSLAGCAQMQMGSSDAKTVATGSAGGANSQNANKQLEHCAAPLGTLAVVEDTRADWYSVLTRQYRLGPTTPVLKLMIQQSNCFVVVDRGRTMRNMMKERELAASGELRGNSNFGKGQMVSADFSMAPTVTFAGNNAGGFGALGGLLGPVGAAVGGSVKSKQASTVLTLDDNRSGVQLAIAEGSAQNWDFGLVGGMLGPGFAGIGGGYSNTPEGKVVVAAFMDAYNGIVVAVRNYQAQHVKGGLGTGGQLGVQGATQNTPQTMSVRDAQARLNALGYSVGTPDGQLGPRTRQQLMQFQRDHRLQATGRLDADTVRALMQ